MSTAARQDTKPKTNPEDKVVKYTPLGGNEEIELTVGTVSNFIAHKTRSGATPSMQHVVNFLMLCKANQLNPWAGDAYLVGYDSKDGPQFSLIVAAQALFKRAELNEDFDGIESGVIIRNGEGKIEYREGDFCLLEGGEERLLGGWARVSRKDCDKPFYDALNLSVFSTGRSRWAKDPAGMIVKVAESSALRKAFPNSLGGCYTREEMDHVIEGHVTAREDSTVKPTMRGVIESSKSEVKQESSSSEEPASSSDVVADYLKLIGEADEDTAEAIAMDIETDDSLDVEQVKQLLEKLSQKFQ